MADAHLPTAIDCSNNLVYKDRLWYGHGGCAGWPGIRRSSARTGVVPEHRHPDGPGGQTGELSTQLSNSATFYEEELDYAVEKMTGLFEPITILFIGLVVGFVAVAMVSAMYGLYNQVDLG